MRKRFFFNIKNIDLLPVFIPVILSLCSWTIYKVAHKNEKIKASKNQYFSPFKINCDFLKPFSTSAVEKKEPLISESSSSDSLFAPSATKVGKINKKLFSAQLDNMHYENKGLVNSGYIGEIGNKDNNYWDADPSDNLFNIPLSNINKNSSYTLTYDVDGYSNINSVTRSINGSYAVGGYLKTKKSGWTEVKENIDPSLLKAGGNMILFNALNKGEYYTIKNVKITENKISEQKDYEIVSKIYRDKAFYIRGFVNPSSKIDFIEIENKRVSLRGNEFEYLSLDENKEASIRVKFVKNDKSIEEEIVSKDQNQDVVSEINSYKELGKNIVYKNESGIVLGLRNIDLPPVDRSISNISGGYYGFRFMGNTSKEAVIHLPYDESKLPNGYHENDITTFTFDYTQKKWMSIAVDSINFKKKYVVFRALLGNGIDYINGVIKQPESPETNAFTPTTVNDVPIANPASKINLISAPSANQQGSAVVQYPIEIPKGTSGLQPSIAITYNSDSKSGWAGTGWDIPVETIDIDTRWGVPAFDPLKESEIYTLDGEQLVFNDSYLPNKVQFQENRSSGDTRFYYRTGITEGLFIKRKGSTPTSYTWEVLDRNGITKEYSEFLTDNASNNTSGNRIRWYLTKVTDRYNNIINYKYTDSFEGGGKGKYLSSITYSNNTVITFDNETGVRNDRAFSYKLGVKLTEAKILNKISVFRANIKIREYQLLNTNVGQFNKRLLSEVIQKDGNGNEFNRHQFSYNTARIFEDQPKTYNTGSDVGNVGPFNGGNVSAISGDFSDNINKARGSLTVGSGSGCFFIGFNKKNTFGVNASYSENKTYGKSQLMDIDGDGLPDKVFYGINGNVWFRKNAMFNFGGVYNTVNWPVGTPLSKTSSYVGSAGFEFNYKSFAAGVNVNWTNSNTPVYFSDVNGDGLPDLISYGDVYFSRIRNGVPEFEPQQENGPNVTETTPNAILSGVPAVQIIEPGQTGPQLLGNIVRMWEAPIDGKIKVTTNAELEANSVDGVDVWMELGGMIKAYEDNPSYVPPHSTMITSPVTLTNQGQPVSISEMVDVKKGQRIFVVASAKENPVKDRIVSNTEISYFLPNSPTGIPKDANGNYLYGFNSSYTYLASSKKGNMIGEKAKVNISWGNMGNQEFTDDINFKIYKIVIPKSDTTGFIQPSISNLIYHHKLLKGETLNTLATTSNLISGVDLSNLLVNQVVSDSTITFFNFDVSADTNVSWDKIRWKPELEVTTDTEILQLKALVEYKPYGERLTDNLAKNFRQYVPLGQLSSCRYMLYPKYGSSINDVMTLNLPQLHNTKVTFSLKIKNTSGKVYTYKNIVDVVNNSMPTPRLNYCEIAADLYANYGINDYQLYDMDHYFEISSLDYDVAKYLAAINPDIYNSNFEPNGLQVGQPNGTYIFVPASTGHKADHFAYRANNTHYNITTGLVYQGWGGFSYNGSKYKGETIRESEFNSSLSGFNVNMQNPSIPCSGDPASQAYQDCVINYVSQMMNTRYFTPIDLKGDAETYTSSLESAEVGQYHLQPALLGTFTDPDTESQYPGYSVPNPRAIIKYSKGSGINMYGSAFIIGGNAGFSKDYTKDHFVDFNGDRYPDVVSSYSFQTTNLLGQLGNPGNTFEREIYNTTTNFGIGLGVPVPTKFSNTSNGGFKTGGEKATHTTTSANAVGIGLNVQLGQARSKSKAIWFDINGDGLLDFLSDGILYINNGRNFVSESHNWNVSEPSNNNSSSLSGGGGFSWPNGSLSFGVGLSKSKSTTNTAFIDINGDGLEDKIVKSGNTYEMLVNTGTTFTNDMMSADFELENKQNSSGFNLYGTLCFCLGLKVCIGFGYNKDKSVSKQTVDLRDFDGDGLPDLLISDDESSLKVYHNNLGKANLLVGITNPLKGKIELDYDIYNTKKNYGSLIGGTYQMPFSKMALIRATVFDYASKNTFVQGVPRIIPKSQVTFEYEKGIQDRREREFLGFGIVKTITYGGLEDQLFTPYQTYVTEYETNFNSSDFFVNYNDSRVRQYFYKKGLVRSTYLLDQGQRKRSETKYTYRYFDQLSNMGYQLSEGQAEPQYKDIGRIVPLLYKIENITTEFVGNNSHSKTLISTVDQYDKYGSATLYTDRGTTLSYTSDDIVIGIGYHDPGAKNVVGIPSTHTIIAGNITRVTNSNVNSNRNITNISRLINGQQADTDMEYDSYGNVTKVTEPASANTQRFTKRYEYDPIYNTYLISIKDSYNLSSSTQYDSNYLFGVPTVMTDANGASSYYNYDAFGRVTQYRSPVDNDWTIKFYYYPNEVIPVAITERKAPIVNNVTPSINYFSSLFTNALGDEISVKKLFNVVNRYYFANNVLQIKDYLARPVKTILRDKVTVITGSSNVIPTLKKYDDYVTAEDQAAKIYITTTYDEMGRELTSTQNNVQTNNGLQNLVNQNVYGFGPDRDGIAQFTSTSISPLGNTAVMYTDEKGRITAAKQTDGSQNLWVSNKYDALSQLIQVKDQNNNITSYEYDIWGRKIKIIQPDAGEMNYQYDNSGKLISSDNSVINALGKTMTYTYDYNRLSKVVFGTYDFVKYEYGDAGAADFSAGRLVSQVDKTGSQSFKYTALGQVKENTRIVVAPNNAPKLFKTSFVYDVYNRINKITYPDSEEVYYNYNAAGLLKNIYSKLPVNQPLVPIVSDISYDNRDKMVSFTAGNTTQNNYNYDAWGRLAELSLFYSNTVTQIRNNQYTFDGNGNIVNVIGTTPMAGNFPEGGITAASQKSYKYDGFNRLSSSVITTQGKEYSQYYDLNMTYNSVGNIQVKDYRQKSYENNITCQNPGNIGKLGTYFYDTPGHPNAVSRIEYNRNYAFNSPLDCGLWSNIFPTDGAEEFTYNANGSLDKVFNIIGGKPDLFRQLFWSEKEDLKAIGEKGVLSHYVYDAEGERILKSDGVSKKMYVNGNDPKNTTQMGAYTYYPSGYVVLGEKTMSKHYFIGDQRIATRVSNIPTHIFKIDETDVYHGLRGGLQEEVTDIADQAQYPEVVWVPNADTQGTYTSPGNTLVNEADCDYTIEQLIINFSQHEDKESCYNMLLDMYSNTLTSGGSFCTLLNDIVQDNPDGCMTGETLPEILDSEMYWIYPDHLGSSSVLINSGSKITNWYEYMPFGESLMELSNQDYNNPYKYNGKEFDSQTGLYYYGARYYDPLKSLWLSVDPMVEKYPTISPYAYGANNPILFKDPNGGEIVIYYMENGRERKYTYGSNMKIPNNSFVKNTISVIDKLIEKNAFDNIVVYKAQTDGKGIKIDGNFLNKVINDKKKNLNILPFQEGLNKANLSSTYKPNGYIPNSGFAKLDTDGIYSPNGTYGTIKFNDEYGYEFIKNGKKFTNSPTSALGHEIVHSIHANGSAESNKIYNSYIGNDSEKKAIEEQSAVDDNNPINLLLGEETKIDHSATRNVRMDNPTINKESKK
ncbi:RHS repeat-associated core domain-containing protein [Chryseobacterium sp. SIMBA_038]|uniref:RHS repeat-associated core domain-containing protein n=9 Tax=Bacteria TaxID=2 RepID=UPI00397843F0